MYLIEASLAHDGPCCEVAPPVQSCRQQPVPKCDMVVAVSQCRRGRKSRYAFANDMENKSSARAWTIMNNIHLQISYIRTRARNGIV